MGSWSVSCGISNISITHKQECYLIPLRKSTGDRWNYLPATLPILGEYDDYGGLENIVKCANTKLIENTLGISIEEFVSFLVNGEFTYNRSEIDHIREKLIANGKLDNISHWRFMFVDAQVYDVMLKNYNNTDCKKYDINDKMPIETLQLWIDEVFYSTSEISTRRYNKILAEIGREYVVPDSIYDRYWNDIDQYCDLLAEMINVTNNLFYMSSCWRPHELYLTPQCGEYKLHQILLEEFARINKSYIDEDDED